MKEEEIGWCIDDKAGNSKIFGMFTLYWLFEKLKNTCHNFLKGPFHDPEPHPPIFHQKIGDFTSVEAFRYIMLEYWMDQLYWFETMLVSTKGCGCDSIDFQRMLFIWLWIARALTSILPNSPDHLLVFCAMYYDVDDVGFNVQQTQSLLKISTVKLKFFGLFRKGYFNTHFHRCHFF